MLANKSNKLAGVIMPFLAFVAFAGMLFGAIWYFNPLEKNTTESRNPNPVFKVREPSPAPILFEEMTIPALRSRDYESRLDELERLNANSSYTTYLTSYNSDGFRVNGLLTIPTGPEPNDGWPAIVFVHGYIPPTLYRTEENYQAYVDYLAKEGFVVFKIDLRGHADSEGEAFGGYYSDDYVVDTLNARSALQNSEFVNPNAIGLWGHSMAGNVTFRSFVAARDVPVLVIWAGAVYTYEDMRMFGIQDNSYRPPDDDSPRRKERELLRQTHGDFDPESEFWKQIVPTNYLDGVSGAIQIHHAVNDDVVSIEYSRNLMNLLENTSIEHELIEHQDGGHNISGPDFVNAMRMTSDFFKENLK